PVRRPSAAFLALPERPRGHAPPCDRDAERTLRGDADRVSAFASGLSLRTEGRLFRDVLLCLWDTFLSRYNPRVDLEPSPEPPCYARSTPCGLEGGPRRRMEAALFRETQGVRG